MRYSEERSGVCSATIRVFGDEVVPEGELCLELVGENVEKSHKQFLGLVVIVQYIRISVLVHIHIERNTVFHHSNIIDINLTPYSFIHRGVLVLLIIVQFDLSECVESILVLTHKNYLVIQRKHTQTLDLAMLNWVVG